MIERNITKEIRKSILNNKLTILKGPCFIGKSTILKSFIKELGRDYFVFYLNLENKLNAESVNESFENLFKLIPATNEKKYFFIDDIHNLKNPNEFLKELVSYNGNVRFVVSISSIYKQSGYEELKKEENIKSFTIMPLSFYEFLKHKGIDINDEAHIEFFKANEKLSFSGAIIRKYEDYFYEYITYGGYPKVVYENDKKEKVFALETIVNSYINSDLVRTGIKDTLTFYKLMKILAERIGGLAKAREFAKMLKVSSPTIDQYLKVLERSAIIKTVKPFCKKYKKEISKVRKFYFCDFGIRNFLLNDFSKLPIRWDRDIYFENIVFNFLSFNESVRKINFWRTQLGHEIDFLINGKYALDTKYSIKSINERNYKIFREFYPGIKVKFATFADVPAKAIRKTAIV